MYLLVELLDQLQQSEKAFFYLQSLITMKIEARGGINFRAMDTCLMPKLALSVLFRHANDSPEYPVSPGFVMYLRLLVEMMAAPECANFVSPTNVMRSSRDIVNVMSDVMGVAAVPSAQLCRHQDLRDFIAQHRYTLHNCHI